jgi:FixJ family two-component response regulator
MGADGRPVIVVDDEKLVADTIAMILRSNGYDALALYAPRNEWRATRRLHSATLSRLPSYPHLRACGHD